jgi:hypothetical protein
MKYLPLNNGQHSQTFAGPRFEYCAMENSTNIIGMAMVNMNIM